MNQIQQTQANLEPCESQLLWFMSERMNDKRVVSMSIDDIMREFEIDSFVAQTLIDNVTNPMVVNFVEKIGDNQYQVTDLGMTELDWLKRFVPVLSKRKVNPRNAIRISVKLREWFKGVDPQSVSVEDAKFITRLNSKKQWTDEEIEVALRIYQNNTKAGF